jgi:hypothetical protein
VRPYEKVGLDEDVEEQFKYFDLIFISDGPTADFELLVNQSRLLPEKVGYKELNY